jgi:hypothetical protein
MTETRRDHVHRHRGKQQRRCVNVPEVVQPDPSQRLARVLLVVLVDQLGQQLRRGVG